MPYGFTYGYAKKKKKRYRYGRRYKKSKASKSRRQKMLKRQVLSILNTRAGGLIGKENKWITSAVNNRLLDPVTGPQNTVILATVGDASGNTYWNSISQGNSPNQRIGRKVSMNKILIRGNIYMQPHSSGEAGVNSILRPGVVRVVAVLDRQANSAAAADINEVLEVLSTTEADVYDFRNLDNANRFRVVMDRIITVEPPSISVAANSYSAGNIVQFQEFFDCQLDVINEGTSGDNIIQNALALHAFTMTQTGDRETATSETFITAQIRIRYTDA